MGNLRDIWVRKIEYLFKVQIRRYKLKIGAEYAYVKPKSIVFVEADGNYSIIHCVEEKLMISKNISKVEQILSGWGMVRVTRSHIVNVVHISRIKYGHPSHVVLTNGIKIEIPKRTSKRTIRKVERMKS